MRPATLLAPALLLLVSSPLLSTAWPGGATAKRASQAVEAPAEHSGGLQDFLEGIEARTATRAQEPALTLPSNPSCFYRALSSLPSSTSSPPSSACDTLAYSDQLRSELAARMAMCEIGTSEGAKVPRECEDWEKGTKRGKVASCVEALSRSPQHWSSYSGYLREIVTLCSAFRRWADVELARDLHDSSARTFAAFAEELREYERKRAAAQAEDEAKRARSMKDLTTALSSLTSLLSQLSTSSATHSADLEGISSTLQTATTILAHELTVVSAGLSDLVDIIKEEVAEATSEMKVALRRGVTEHETSLAALADGAQNRLADSLDLVATRQAALAGGLHDLVSTAQSAGEALREVNSALLDLHPAAEALSSSLTGSLSTASLLETQLSTVATANLAQAHHLGAVLANLTSLAEQRQGGLMGEISSRLDTMMGWEEIVWLVQVVLGPARSFFGWRSILGVLGTLYLLLSGWGGFDWSTVLGIVFVLSALIVSGDGSRIPFFLGASLRRLFSALRRLLLPQPRRTTSSPASSAFNHRLPRPAVRFALPPSPPVKTLSIASSSLPLRPEERSRRFMRAASAPL